MELQVEKKYGVFRIGSTLLEGAQKAPKCLNGDTVNYENSICSLVRRANHPVLVGILQTCGPKYGFTSHGNAIYLCRPMDERYPQFYIGSKIKDTIKNKYITFRFESWPENSIFPKGTFIDLLGDCGVRSVEEKALIYNYSPYTLKKISTPVVPSFEGRERIRGYTLNIDPDGCKDVDDCLSFWDNKVAISIADVSAWCTTNPELVGAQHIGTSLYKNGVCVKPMLPPIYSEDLCSLVVGQDRLALSLIIEFSDSGITSCWVESIVRVDAAYTYDSIYNNREYSSKIRRYASLLSKQELEDSHSWVEAFMVYYNAQVGTLLKTHNVGILRSHRGKNLELCKLFTPLSETYQVLCNYAANYCLPTELTTHVSLGLDAYAHASSPIRRYADIVNQCALKNILFAKSYCVPYSINTLNRCMKGAKRYTRDLVFIDLYYSTSVLSGIVLHSNQIFITQLQKVIVYSNDLEPGTSINLSYYTDQQQLQWKTRVIFKILDI